MLVGWFDCWLVVLCVSVDWFGDRVFVVVGCYGVGVLWLGWILVVVLVCFGDVVLCVGGIFWFVVFYGVVV